MPRSRNTETTLDSIDQQIIAAIRANKEAKSPQILSALKGRIDQSTLSRRTRKLIDKGYITKIGSGKNTRYKLDDYKEYFAVPPTKRPSVNYKFAFLRNYKPNKTLLFAEDELAALKEAGQLPERPLSTNLKLSYKKFLIDLSWASSALEGNTYSLSSAKELFLYLN